MNYPRSPFTFPRRLSGVIRVVLGAAAFLGLANPLCAEDQLSYRFTTAARSAATERSATISLDVWARDDGSYSAVYSHRDRIRETLNDVKAVTFERKRVLTATEAAEFFASLLQAGLWKLPRGENSIEDAPNSQIYATISGRNLQFCYNSPIKGAARQSFHTAVTAFARKLGIDQPEDAGKATHIVEGDRTPAREIPFSSLITNPARYDGKRIAVTGFYHGEFECSILVPERFDWNGLDDDREFWVQGDSKFARRSDAPWKNDSWVRVEGVFSARYGGHLGGSPGVINRVTKFTPLDGPPNPAAVDPSNEDDPHGLDKLTLEIQIQPFPMDGRPVQEVVAALNQQIAAHLAKRGLAEDWLKIKLDLGSNPKSRIEEQIEKPEPLRRILGMLAIRVSADDDDPSDGRRANYRYILPNVILLRANKSIYPDDKEPFSFHEATFGKQAVRAKLVRYAAQSDAAPETFRVEWQCEMKPEDLRIAEALALIHRVVPDEPGAKSLTSIDISRRGETWRWIARTDALQAIASPALERVPDSIYPSPVSIFSKREYVPTIDAHAVYAAPAWNFTSEPPLELDAAIHAARQTLKEIPNAEASLQLKEISLVHLDATHCAYQITFHDSATSNSYLIIPVLLSGKAIAPKPEPTPKTQE